MSILHHFMLYSSLLVVDVGLSSIVSICLYSFLLLCISDDKKIKQKAISMFSSQWDL